MRINILVAGKGGLGVNECSSILGEALSMAGYYCFMYREYESRIEGGHIFNILTVSDEPIQSYDSEIDILVVMDMRVLKYHEKDMKKNGVIITEDFLKFDELMVKNNFDKKVGNMIFASAILKVLGLDKDVLIKAIDNSFTGKIAEEDKRAVGIGYEILDKGEFLDGMNPVKKKLYFVSGNEGVGMGAIASGLDIYLGYPMTPATTVMHYLTSKQVKENIFVYYVESEVAAINAVIGASFAGARAMTGTSGGGYDLMSEGISFQGIAELPLIVFLGQRSGPGTGIPTYNMQADLNIALKSSHGEFPRVVIAPGDALECIEATNQAFYLAHKYRTVGIILSDKNVGENRYCFSEIPMIVEVPRNISLENPNGGLFENYKITNSGVSPAGMPGRMLVKVDSQEHDEQGLTIEDGGIAKKMFEKRMKKMQGIEKDARKFNMVKFYGNMNGKKLIITWGSNKGAILDYLKNDKDAKMMQILYMSPFPTESVKKEIEKAREVFVSELNYFGQLADLIAEKTGIFIPRENRILKYDGRAFTPGEITERMGGKND